MAAGLMSAIYQVNLDFADIDVQLFAFIYNVTSLDASDRTCVGLDFCDDVI